MGILQVRLADNDFAIFQPAKAEVVSRLNAGSAVVALLTLTAGVALRSRFGPHRRADQQYGEQREKSEGVLVLRDNGHGIGLI